MLRENRVMTAACLCKMLQDAFDSLLSDEVHELMPVVSGRVSI